MINIQKNHYSKFFLICMYYKNAKKKKEKYHNIALCFNNKKLNEKLKECIWEKKEHF